LEAKSRTVKKKGKSRSNPEVDKRQCYADGSYLRGLDLIRFVKQERGETVLLSFSRGKDSMAVWLYLRDHFNILPFYLYLIPGLSWEEESLNYYERFFNTHILRLPHPLFYQMLRNGEWQTPETVPVIRAMNLPAYDLSIIDNLIAIDCLGLDENTPESWPFCAMGIRQCDSLERRRLIQQMGVVGLGKKRRFFYPIWDWKIDQVGRIILDANLKLPIDYDLFGRTVVALNYRRLVKIRHRYPGDYQKILEWFPLAELEIFRYEKVSSVET